MDKSHLARVLLVSLSLLIYPQAVSSVSVYTNGISSTNGGTSGSKHVDVLTPRDPWIPGQSSGQSGGQANFGPSGNSWALMDSGPSISNIEQRFLGPAHPSPGVHLGSNSGGGISQPGMMKRSSNSLMNFNGPMGVTGNAMSAMGAGNNVKSFGMQSGPMTMGMGGEGMANFGSSNTGQFMSGAGISGGMMNMGSSNAGSFMNGAGNGGGMAGTGQMKSQGFNMVDHGFMGQFRQSNSMSGFPVNMGSMQGFQQPMMTQMQGMPSFHGKDMQRMSYLERLLCYLRHGAVGQNNRMQMRIMPRMMFGTSGSGFSGHIGPWIPGHMPQGGMKIGVGSMSSEGSSGGSSGTTPNPQDGGD